MIECLPQSLCSWNYTASGLASGSAVVEYDWLTEQGRMVVAQNEYTIRKHGPLSGHWTLEQSGRVVAHARKPSAMFRSFEITGEAVQITLRAESPLTRKFELAEGQHVMGSIEPAHAFTRRATIQCADSVSEPMQLFAFWLVGLTWRRSANSSS